MIFAWHSAILTSFFVQSARFVGTMLISLLATLRVKRAFSKYSQVPTSSGFSGAEAAEQILQASGIHDVEVVAYDEMLGDHYDPTRKRLVLSQKNFHGRSVHRRARVRARHPGTSKPTRRCNGAWVRSG